MQQPIFEMNPINHWFQEASLTLIVEKADDFGKGIAESFVRLADKLNTPGQRRECYGIITKENGNLEYYAAFTELYEKEAEDKKLPKRILESGKYVSIVIHEWNKNLLHIGPTFDQILKSGLADANKPCIEFYKSEQELVCMVQAKQD